MRLGYSGVQMGTRFIASEECKASLEYKKAILAAKAKDTVMSVKLTGVPVSVISNDYVKKQGTSMPKWLLKLSKLGNGKHLVRLFYSLSSLWKLKKSMVKSSSSNETAAGKSVENIDAIEKCETIVSRLSKVFDR